MKNSKIEPEIKCSEPDIVVKKMKNCKEVEDGIR